MKGKESEAIGALIKKIHVEAISVWKTKLREIILGALVEDEYYLHVKECV